MTDFRSLLSLAVVYAPTSFKEEEGEGGQQQKKPLSMAWCETETGDTVSFGACGSSLKVKVSTEQKHTYEISLNYL